MPPKKDDATADRDAQLKASREETDRQTEEQIARQSARPTPTQDENDRAKLGLQSLEELDDKEPDGSPEEEPARRGALNYRTRDASPSKGGETGGGASDNS
jgi:hypothetical protein